MHSSDDGPNGRQGPIPIQRRRWPIGAIGIHCMESVCTGRGIVLYRSTRAIVLCCLFVSLFRVSACTHNSNVVCSIVLFIIIKQAHLFHLAVRACARTSAGVSLRHRKTIQWRLLSTVSGRANSNCQIEFSFFVVSFPLSVHFFLFPFSFSSI